MSQIEVPDWGASAFEAVAEASILLRAHGEPEAAERLNVADEVFRAVVEAADWASRMRVRGDLARAKQRQLREALRTLYTLEQDKP